jgi:cyclopropane-fatty-acyl-phospholipid synthase
MDVHQDATRGPGGDTAVRNPALQTHETTVGKRPALGEKVLPADRWLIRRVLRGLGNPPLRVVFWNGEEIATSEAAPVARVIFHDRSTLLKVMANPDLGFGNAFSEGRLEVDGDLVEFLETVYAATPLIERTGFFKRQWQRWRTRPKVNTLSGSRDNIHRHYDIGNEFYKLWLDEQLVYTCAYFPTPEATLEEAQVAKMDHVCRKLRLQPGESVFEAGCGWGALARHMARHYGVKVRAFNIAHEQIAYARERARAEGLDGQIEYIEDDYRTVRGRCDKFVSVGMLEHVGVENYQRLGEVIHRTLKPSGLGLIHSIGRNQQKPMNAWLERRIFPGAYLPTLREMLGVTEPWAFSVLDVENLRLHYAKTLEHWLHRFDGVADQVVQQFDRSFVRAWRLYMASSIAGFSSGHIELFQLVFAPGRSNAIPWTRADL